MTDAAKLNRARQFIEKGKYAKARRILIPLALTNNTAREMLKALDEAAPPTLKSARPFGILSTIASLIWGGGMVSIALLVFVLLMCGALVMAGFYGPI